MSIAAEVATKTSLGNANAARASPRTAPPVPTSPAMPPDNAPASIAVAGGRCDRPTRAQQHPATQRQQEQRQRHFEGMGRHVGCRQRTEDGEDHRRHAQGHAAAAGRCRRGTVPSLLALLARWNSAVMPSTDSKSKKKLAIGTKNTDEPKPPTVPATSASKASARNSRACSMFCHRRARSDRQRRIRPRQHHLDARRVR